MNRPFILYRLQQIDLRIDKINSRLIEIDKELSDDKQLNLAKENVNLAETKLGSNKKTLKQSEIKVSEQQSKIRLTEAKLYSGKVQNPKELQDLQNELSALKRYLNTLEDHQLEAMVQEESAEEELNSAQQILLLEEKRFAQKRSELSYEKNKLLGDLTIAEEERNAVAVTISNADIALYEKIRKTHRGIAVTKVEDKVCSACGVRLNASLLSICRSPDNLSRCDNCGRILYAGG